MKGMNAIQKYACQPARKIRIHYGLEIMIFMQLSLEQRQGLLHYSHWNSEILMNNSWNMTFLSIEIRYRNVSQMDKILKPLQRKFLHCFQILGQDHMINASQNRKTGLLRMVLGPYIQLCAKNLLHFVNVSLTL